MANPEFIEQKPLSLTDVQEAIEIIEKRDKELNYQCNKVKEYLGNLTILPKDKAEKLSKKLADLGLTRLKEEQIAKIVDFLPKDTNELKVVLQAYPLSMPKKDMDVIVQAVAEFTGKK